MAVLILFTEPIRFLAGNSYAAASSPRRRKIMQRSTLPELPRLESVLAKNVPVHVQHRLRFEWAQIEQSASHGATALCHSFRCSRGAETANVRRQQTLQTELRAALLCAVVSS